MSLPPALEPFRLVASYWDGRFCDHPSTSKYFKILEVGENYYLIGFEDLDESLGFIPDYDYKNPVIRVVLFGNYALAYIKKVKCDSPVMHLWVFYGWDKVFFINCPPEGIPSKYVLLSIPGRRLVASADFLKLLLLPRGVTSVWGFPVVKKGTTLTLYVTAESEGMTINIVITKPDGTKITGTMTDLGNGNYAYQVTFDQEGEWLIEYVYPDGFKRKKIVIVY